MSGSVHPPLRLPDWRPAVLHPILALETAPTVVASVAEVYFKSASQYCVSLMLLDGVISVTQSRADVAAWPRPGPHICL